MTEVSSICRMAAVLITYWLTINCNGFLPFQQNSYLEKCPVGQHPKRLFFFLKHWAKVSICLFNTPVLCISGTAGQRRSNIPGSHIVQDTSQPSEELCACLTVQTFCVSRSHCSTVCFRHPLQYLVKKMLKKCQSCLLKLFQFWLKVKGEKHFSGAAIVEKASLKCPLDWQKKKVCHFDCPCCGT